MGGQLEKTRASPGTIKRGLGVPSSAVGMEYHSTYVGYY